MKGEQNLRPSKLSFFSISFPLYINILPYGTGTVFLRVMSSKPARQGGQVWITVSLKL
jgi:hypothetical protein